MRSEQFSYRNQFWLQTVGICALLIVIAQSFCAQAFAQSPNKSGCNAPTDTTLGQVIGGLAGGLAGNQVGKGNGNAAATIGGVLLGGLAGGELQKQMQKPDCKTSEKQKQKLKAPVNPRDAKRPAATAPAQANTAPIATAPIAAGAIAAGAIAASPDNPSLSQDQSAANLQSQYAAAKAMYESHPVYRQRIDKMMTQSLADYDATRETETAMEAQFHDAGITTQYDTRIGELRNWIARNRNDIAANHVELTDKLRELAGLKRQQTNEWNRQAASSAKPANTSTQNADISATPPTSTPPLVKVAQISARFAIDDSDSLIDRKRKFLFKIIKAGSDTFDESDPAYQTILLKLQGDYPEFQDEIYKVLTEPNYKQGFADDLFADSKARFLTDGDYRNSQTKSIQLALAEYDINAEGDADNEKMFKAVNFTTRYDAPISAVKSKISQERNDVSNYLILGFDILKYTNLRDWRVAEWNKRIPEQKTSSDATSGSFATQDIAKIVDTVITEDSKTWVMHRYDQHSAKNVKITKADAAGQPAIVRADFTYNRGERGWVELHYKGAKLSCLKFFDFPDRCRAIGNSPSVDILSGFIMDMALDTGSSGSGGGGDFCVQNPQLKQCGGGSYEPSNQRPAPPVAPISDFYADKHW